MIIKDYDFSDIVIVDREKLSSIHNSSDKLVILNGVKFLYVKEHDFYVNKKYYLVYLEYNKFNRINHFFEFSNEIHNVDINKLKKNINIK